MYLPFHQGVSAFWSASDTDFKNLSLGVSTFWSASDTYFKNLSLVVSLLIRVSLPLGVFTYWSGCHCLLISKWHWLQKPKFKLSLAQVVSTFWSASDTDFKNLCLGVYTFWSASDTDCLQSYIRVSPCLLISKWQWLQKPKSPTFIRGSCLCLLISKWHWLQKPMFGCLHLLIRVSLTLGVLHLFHQGVSAFWSASDTDFKNLSSNFQEGGCLHLLISKWHTDFKNLSLDISTFWWVSLWVHLLLIRVSPLWVFCFLIRVSPPFDQQVTLTSKT